MNPFPQNFQNRPYTPYPTNNGITWVQGVEGAKAYQLMPSSNIILMDSENDGIFYIKVSDNIGMCTLRTFKFSEIADFVSKDNRECIDTSKFVLKEDFDRVIKELKGENLDEPVIPTTQSNTTKRRLISE